VLWFKKANKTNLKSKQKIIALGIIEKNAEIFIKAPS
jgi:hypothetical protein|tara:strand:- start:2280 stop:2390 length:111 start_codon:yes stop_codon:yes gene_type:complete